MQRLLARLRVLSVKVFFWQKGLAIRSLFSLLQNKLDQSSHWPGWVSFAQRWYSNQWSNREMLLLLVENYTQYPALLVWNITSWGNFWRPLLELIEMKTCNTRLLVLSPGGEKCNLKWPELSQTDTREKTSDSIFGWNRLLSGLSSVLNKTGLWLRLITEQSVVPE